MNEDYLKELRKLALYFKLDVGPKYGGAIDVDSLAKVLKAVSTSFHNYFDAELRNIFQEKGKITAQVEKEINAMQEEARLLIVDLKFASFEAAVASDTVTSAPYAHIQQPLNTKKRIFKSFESDVFFTNLNDPKSIERLKKKFAREELNGIFKPLDETVFNSTRYSFRYGKSFDSLNRSFNSLRPESKKKLISPPAKPQITEQYYKAYFINEGELDLFGRPRIKKLLATEKLPEPTYPLQFSSIKDEGTEIILNQPLTADVSYDKEEETFFVSFPPLNILVWDKEREDADAAFKFAFISLVQNLYNEDDEKLTEKAKTVKQVLTSMIREIR